MEERVRAAVRIKGASAALQVDDCRVSIPARDGKGQLTYVLDRVFDQAASQSEIFSWVEPAVVDVLRGLNATILAYGQTGSGKSYTMGTSRGDDGVVHRATAAIFEAISAHEDDTQSVVHCSFMQIYGDKVFDLLASQSSGNLAVREKAKKPSNDDGGNNTIFVQGLSEYQVACAQDVAALVERGLRSRATRSTEMNSRSSRSHAILQLSVQTESHYDDDEEGVQQQHKQQEGDHPLSPKRRTVLRRAKLQLVDLAGSEKWSTAADTDSALAGELKSINKSLSALGNCFAAVVEKKHVPYRDSTLTRLLQDSLGGGTRAIVVATVDAANLEETASTLAFAQRAKKVTACLRLDEVVNDTVLLKKAQREISSLRKQLQQAQSRDSNLSEERTSENLASMRRIHRFEQQLLEAKSNFDNAERLIGRLYTKLELVEDRESASVAVANAALARSPLAVAAPSLTRCDKTQQTTNENAILSLASSPQLVNFPHDIIDHSSVAVDPAPIAAPIALPDKRGFLDKLVESTPDLVCSNDVSESSILTVDAREAGLCDRHKIRGCFLCSLQTAGDLELGKDEAVSSKDISITARKKSLACERHGVHSCFLCSLRQDGVSEACHLAEPAFVETKPHLSKTVSSMPSLEAVETTQGQRQQNKQTSSPERLVLESPYGRRRRSCRNSGRTSAVYRVSPSKRRPQQRQAYLNGAALQKKEQHSTMKTNGTQRQNHLAAPCRRRKIFATTPTTTRR